MFEGLPEPSALAQADDATVIAAIEGWARAEAAASARRLAAIGELVSRRCDDEDERALWSLDLWDCAAAEVSAALNLNHRRACTQMNLAVALRDRLPNVAALFLAGTLTPRLVSVIAWRTHLVDNSDAMQLIDIDIAEQAHKLGPLSETKLEQVIDLTVQRHDAGALVQFRVAARDRNVEFGKPDDETGTASMWGRLYRTDAEVLDRRLAALARSVCDADPRNTGQRRSDALGALANRAETLMCQCGKTDCPTAGTPSPGPPVVIHVVAEQATVDAAIESIAEVPSARDAGAAAEHGAGAVLVGGGVIPKPLLTELIRAGAKVKPLRAPNVEAEPRYRPSVALQDFIRCRDLTCRFPACDAPAEFCDIDHSVPYPAGLTHPSNLKCLCRKHHLLKTFCTGVDGWADRQLPDGTVVWTSPTGRTYSTHPGSRLFFPAWDVRTATLPHSDPAAATSVGRAVMMPLRQRTRAADRAQRIKAERALNDTS